MGRRPLVTVGVISVLAGVRAGRTVHMPIQKEAPAEPVEPDDEHGGALAKLFHELDEGEGGQEPMREPDE